MEINSSQDSLARHLTNSLFVVVTLFLSCLLLTVAFLPVVWFPWIMSLTGNNLQLGSNWSCRDLSILSFFLLQQIVIHFCTIWVQYWRCLLHLYVDLLLIIEPIEVWLTCFFLWYLVYEYSKGYSQRILNISILQTLTWLATIILCIVCMFRSIAAALAAIFIFIFSRTMLISGCQAVITTRWIPIEIWCYF